LGERRLVRPLLFRHIGVQERVMLQKSKNEVKKLWLVAMLRFGKVRTWRTKPKTVSGPERINALQ